MNSESTGEDLLGHVLLPVANEDDALATVEALKPYGPNHVTALHVVEKGDGVPDKSPVEQSEQLAAESYAAVRSVFPDADDTPPTAGTWPRRYSQLPTRLMLALLLIERVARTGS